MKRRTFLTVLATLTGAGLVVERLTPALAGSNGAMTAASIETMRKDWKALLPVGFQPNTALAPIQKTPAEWKQTLSTVQYDVLREEGTERPFSSPLNNEKRPGVFVCGGCNLPLFTSQMKFDSGTGWPSFFTAIPDHLATKTDHKLFMARTEYHCVRCGGHQGHIFDDGPAPTNLRYCNNGVAIKFVPHEGKA